MKWVFDRKIDPGTESMVNLLSEINQWYDETNRHEVDYSWFRKLLNKIYKSDGAKVLEADFHLSHGQTEGLIEELEVIAARLTPSDDLFVKAHEILAILYLRRGEEENCIHNNTHQSCIFPIREEGIYSLRKDTERAIEIYEKLLSVKPADWRYRWLLNLAYQTLGEYPEEVPKQWLIHSNLMLDRDPSDNFENIAPSLGIDDITPAGGAVMDDFNNDGLLDIFTSGLNRTQLKYYINNGKKGFTDQTSAANLVGLTSGFNLYQLDYDNDGWKDLLVVRGAWKHNRGLYPNSLLRNNQDGTFSDTTVEAGLLSFHPVATAVCADFNNDGWTDIFIGNESRGGKKDNKRNELFLNMKNGQFREVSVESGMDVVSFTKGVCAGDYNDDGLTDLYISDHNGINILLKNTQISADGVPEFKDTTKEAGVEGPLNSFTSWFWDYNNDGALDLFVSSYEYGDARSTAAAAKHFAGISDASSRSFIYHNNGDGTFTNRSFELGLDFPLGTMGANFGDINNDGWLDFYIGTGEPDFMGVHPNRLLVNQEGLNFIDQSSERRVGHIQKGHGIAFGDLDQDGDQDILAEMGGELVGDEFQNALFQNPGNNNNWIVLSLTGTTSSRDAIGARIKVIASDGNQTRAIYRVVSSGGSFGSNSLQQEIGLGRFTQIDLVEIRWPNSTQAQLIQSLNPNRKYSIIEGASDAVEDSYDSFLFEQKNPSEHHHH
ncbi:MAG: hypothetical protein SynsKO_22530 [Synoicihabitans sp.]